SGGLGVAYGDGAATREYMRTFKMGDGPLYCFYTPFHLPHLQVVPTIGRAVLFGDATVAPAAGPMCDAIAVAKRNLAAGEILDGIGGFMCYGMVENCTVAAKRLLPIGLAEGCRLTRAFSKDQAVSYADVEVPPGRLADRLRAEQTAHFSAGIVASDQSLEPRLLA